MKRLLVAIAVVIALLALAPSCDVDDAPAAGPPVILKQPTARVASLWSDVVFQVTAEGDDLTYRWTMFAFDELDRFVVLDVPGGTESALLVPAIPDYDGAGFVCEISGPGGSVQTFPVLLRVR